MLLIQQDTSVAHSLTSQFLFSLRAIVPLSLHLGIILAGVISDKHASAPRGPKLPILLPQRCPSCKQESLASLAHTHAGVKFNIQTAVTDTPYELSYYMFQTFVSLSAEMIHASGCSCSLPGLFHSPQCVSSSLLNASSWMHTPLETRRRRNSLPW